MSGADQPLEAAIEGDQLVIRIGLDTLAWAAERCPKFRNEELVLQGKQEDLGPYVIVENKLELARDGVRELEREEEDGSTPLHYLLDEAIEKAYEEGSTGFTEDSFP